MNWEEALNERVVELKRTTAMYLLRDIPHNELTTDQYEKDKDELNKIWKVFYGKNAITDERNKNLPTRNKGKNGVRGN